MIAGSIDIAPAAAEVTVNVDASVSLGDPALSAAVTALGGRVDTAEADIDALETRMATAESDIDTAETDIDALEERMTTAEGKIDTLEARPQGLLLWSGTQAQYDAIAEKAANTLYVITT